MKQFIRLFLCLALPVVLWLTRHQTVYPQAMAYAEMPKQKPTSFYLQSHNYAAIDIAWAKAFLRDSIHLPTKASSEAIMTHIGTYLIQTLHASMHEATPELNALSPREQFQRIRSKQASFYCSNYVAIYGFFARVAGLAVRDIELKSDARWHIVSETWNPETKTWMLNDLTHQLALVCNQQGKAMSLFDAGIMNCLPATAQPDYAPNATRLLHTQNNALHLQSIQHKLSSFFFSRNGIIPILTTAQNNYWPIVLKYVALLIWLFLVQGFIRGLA